MSPRTPRSWCRRRGRSWAKCPPRPPSAAAGADRGLPMALTKLEHVLVLTEDIEATRDFYRDALGLEQGERPPLEFPGYWLYAGGVPCVHVAERAAYEAHSESIGIPASKLPVDH